MRFDGRLDVMLERPVFRVGDIADSQKLFDFVPAFIGNGNVAMLLIDHKIAGKLRGLTGCNLQLFALF
jgi:hypothetical protein